MSHNNSNAQPIKDLEELAPNVIDIPDTTITTREPAKNEYERPIKKAGETDRRAERELQSVMRDIRSDKVAGVDAAYLIRRLKRILRAHKYIVVREKRYGPDRKIANQELIKVDCGPDHDLHLKALEAMIKLIFGRSRTKAAKQKDEPSYEDPLAELEARERLQAANSDVEIVVENEE